MNDRFSFSTAVIFSQEDIYITSYQIVYFDMDNLLYDSYTSVKLRGEPSSIKGKREECEEFTERACVSRSVMSYSL